MPNHREISTESYEWLISNKYADKTEYLQKLRILQSEINRGLDFGWITKQDSSELCSPDNPHHYHQYQVAPKFEGMLTATIIINQKYRLNNIYSPQTTTSQSIQEIWIGHPCADISLFTQESDRDIPLSRLISFTLNPPTLIQKINRELPANPNEREFEEDFYNIADFSDKQRQILLREGFEIFRLTGQSLRTLINHGCRFRSKWHTNQEIEATTSHSGEVAIKLPFPTLTSSNQMNYIEQIGLITNYGLESRKQIPGVTAVMGNVADYAEIIYNHYTNTGVKLFGKEFLWDNIRTTSTVKSRGAHIGSFGENGLRLGYWHLNSPRESLWAVPLIISSQK